VIDVSDRPDVYVRLAAIKFLFRHRLPSVFESSDSPGSDFGLTVVFRSLVFIHQPDKAIFASRAGTSQEIWSR
jgi:hypothetical protein